MEIRELKLEGINDEIIKRAVSEIARGRQQELYQFGITLSNMAKSKIKGLFSKTESKPSVINKSVEIVEPLLIPIQRGVIDGMQDVAKDFIKYTALGIGSIFLLGFITGRITRKK